MVDGVGISGQQTGGSQYHKNVGVREASRFDPLFFHVEMGPTIVVCPML